MVICVHSGCERTFGSVRGMRVHHAKKHGESISGEPVDCAWCGDTIFRKQSQIDKKDNLFCDRECSAKFDSVKYSGDGNPSYKGNSIECECGYCGETLERPRWDYERVEETFCRDTDCRSKWLSEHHSGENHPGWKGGKIECECHTCGELLRRIPAEFGKYDHQFCSSECLGEWHAEQRSGEDSPLWVEEEHPSYYGASWQSQRRSALERDDSSCQHCSTDEEQHHDEYGTEPHVHHVIPFKHFDDHEEANKLHNLVTLCQDCHYLHERWAGVVTDYVRS